MKVLSPLILASLASAAPSTALERRQVAQELTSGGCKPVIFIWVRGTTESPNLGAIIGGQLVPQIRKVIPDIAVEGVTYGAGIGGNLTPGGGDPAGIADAKRLYSLAASKCPNSIITGGGYSQGAAITHRAVESLPQSVKRRIAAIILYGDTKYKQDGGRIKNFPPEKVRTFCNGYGDLKSASADGVCNGGLNVNFGHLSYGSTFGTAASWLAEKVAAFKSSGGGS